MTMTLAEVTVSRPILAMLKDQVAKLDDFPVEIDPEDEMLLYFTTHLGQGVNSATMHYYQTGKRIYQSLKRFVDWHFGGFDRVSSFLDFACGYGRVNRFLLQELPAERIWVSDIYADAVRFQEEVFGVNGIVSQPRPGGIPVDWKFDCIFASSFFSHMPEATFLPWMEWLYGLLKPGGMLVFSVHDVSLLMRGADGLLPDFHFVPSSESRTLDTAEYGGAYVSQKFVGDVLRRVSGGRAAFHRIERGLNRHQDVYLVADRDHLKLSGPQFAHHPEGYLDHCRVDPNGDIVLSGWAGDFNPGNAVVEVQVVVEGKVIQKCFPYQVRDDVVAYFKGGLPARTGWTCGLPQDQLTTDDVIIVKTVNEAGLETVLAVETLGVLLGERGARVG